MAPYHPIFMDGWSPEYPIPVSDDHLNSVPAAGVTESKKSRDEIKNTNPEVKIFYKFELYNKCTDHIQM